jgi:hypothetical protein
MHLSPYERLKLVHLFFKFGRNSSRDLAIYQGTTYKRVSCAARDKYGIEISERSVRTIMHRWFKFRSVADLPRANQIKLLISFEGFLAINRELLENPFITSAHLKSKLQLVANKRTISHYVKTLGWKKMHTKYCQIVSPENQVI